MPTQLSLLPDTRPVPTITRFNPQHFIVPPHAMPPSAALVASVQTWGVLTPVIAIAGSARADHITIVDGHRRVQAALACTPPAVVPTVLFPHTTSPRMAAAIALTSHIHRAPNPLHDLLAIERLQQEGYTETAICTALNMPYARLQSRLRLQQLIPPWRAALAGGSVSIGVAVRLSRMSVDLQQRFAAMPVEQVTRDVLDAAVREANPQQALPLPAESPTLDSTTRAQLQRLAPPTDAVLTLRAVGGRGGGTEVECAMTLANHLQTSWSLPPSSVRIRHIPMPVVTVTGVRRNDSTNITRLDLQVNLEVLGRTYGWVMALSLSDEQVEIISPPRSSPTASEPAPIRVARETVTTINSILDSSRVARRSRRAIDTALRNLIQTADEYNEGIDVPLAALPAAPLTPGEESWQAVLVHLLNAEHAIPPVANPDADACNASLIELRSRVQQVQATEQRAVRHA